MKHPIRGLTLALCAVALLAGTADVSAQAWPQKRRSSPSTSATQRRRATTWPQHPQGVTTVSQTCVRMGSQRPTR